MNEKELENKQLEELLKKAHLPELSPQLRQRITAAAKMTWNQNETELPWLVPFRRLAASAAAAIIIIWLANYSSDFALAQWQSVKFPAATEQSPDLESLPEIPYGPFVRRMVSVNRRASTIDASALNDHIGALQNILDEVQQTNTAVPSAPSDGTSHLISNPPNSSSYS
jgi:hypothetical protein